MNFVETFKSRFKSLSQMIKFIKNKSMLIFISAVVTPIIYLMYYFAVDNNLINSEISAWKDFAVFFDGIATPSFVLLTVVLLYKTWRDNKKELELMREQAELSNQKEIASFYYPLIKQSLENLIEKLPDDIYIFEVSTNYTAHTRYDFLNGIERYLYLKQNTLMNDYILPHGDNFPKMVENLSNNRIKAFYESHAREFIELAYETVNFPKFSHHINSLIVKNLGVEHIQGLLLLFIYEAFETKKTRELKLFLDWLLLVNRTELSKSVALAKTGQSTLLRELYT